MLYVSFNRLHDKLQDYMRGSGVEEENKEEKRSAVNCI